jgi:hypothetical protein
MARRTAARGSGSWLFAAMMIAGVLVLLWWISARRAETPAPPSTVPGARILKEAPPEAGDSRAAGSEEITPPEKRELERVLRERGTATGRE